MRSTVTNSRVARRVLKRNDKIGSAKRSRRDVHGVLLLDKPTGLSSNQALQRVKRNYQAAKAGHTGSLDPLATGMLPICFGEATKLTGYMLAADKTYRVCGQLGVATATGDSEGDTVTEKAVPQMSEQQIRQTLATFVGELDQVPPMYSALKHEGQRLYALARAGVEVKRAARRVTVYTIDLKGFDACSLDLEIRCSKGTYVRTLIEDIAIALGTVGHVRSLRRLRLGLYNGKSMVTLAQVESCAASGLAALDSLLLPVESPIMNWPRVLVDQPDVDRLICGQPVSQSPGVQSGLVRLYAPAEKFLGVGEILSPGKLVPRRIFPGLGPWS